LGPGAVYAKRAKQARGRVGVLSQALVENPDGNPGRSAHSRPTRSRVRSSKRKKGRCASPDRKNGDGGWDKGFTVRQRSRAGAGRCNDHPWTSHARNQRAARAAASIAPWIPRVRTTYAAGAP